MPDPTFNEPRIALNRVYTRTGDAGETGLTGGQRVLKNSPRIECFGTVDELNAFVGAARLTAEDSTPLAPLSKILFRVQHELFNLGSELSTLQKDLHPKQPRITESEVRQLEAEIDSANESLTPLRSFVLPGGSRISTDLHIARTVCRRAERLLIGLIRAEEVPEEAIQYLNRLSDALFVWSRWANHLLGAEEVLWQPNEAASAKSEI